MGTDIHGVIQQNKKGKWKTIEKLSLGQNYPAFALLGNVRNGHGFAGSPTHEPLPFISNNRDLPGDFCEEEASEVIQDLWMGEHSFTWVGLDELLNVNWYERYVNYGVVDEKTYLDWLKEIPRKPPKDSCSSVSGEGVLNLTMAEYQQDFQTRFSLKPRPEGKEIYIQIAWAESLKDMAPGLHELMINLQKQVLENEEEIRVVMGFDS